MLAPHDRSAPRPTDFISVWVGNPLAHTPHDAADILNRALDAPAAPRIHLSWSGRAPTPDAGLFDRDPASWLPSGGDRRAGAAAPRDAFDRLCDALAPVLSPRSALLIFRPHCRHVLSDPPAAVAFLRRWEGAPFRIALDPVSMLEPEMLPAAADHVTRAFEALAPAAALIIAAGWEDDRASGRVAHRPLTPGADDHRLVTSLIASAAPPEVPVWFVAASDIADAPARAGAPNRR